MNNIFLNSFLAATFITVVITPLVIFIAKKLKILDVPGDRKVHKQATPLLGGISIFISFVVVVWAVIQTSDILFSGYLHEKHLAGIVLGCLILMIGGYFDDKYSLPPKLQIIFPILATLSVIALGVGIKSISNPIFGGFFNLDALKIQIFSIHGIPYYFTVIADVFSFAWLMGMMYTTKYLDGLDGLVSGVTVIAALIIFFVSQHITLQQDYVALLAIIVAGAFLGFLFFNFNPASIFLGEGGSLMAGFLIGVLSIMAGSKIATALLVFGIPIADVIWVLARRLKNKKSLVQGDSLHLHHRLLKLGLSAKQSVLLLYFLVFIFGSMTLFFQTRYKLYILILLALFMFCSGVYLVAKLKRNEK